MQQSAPHMDWYQLRLLDLGAAANPEQAFAELVTRNCSLVFRVAFTVLHNSHDAEDVTQETFLRVYRKDNWKTIDDERAYLARVAWRVAISKRRPSQNLPLVDAASLAPTPEEIAARSNWHSIIHTLIDALPDELRHPLLLSMTEELKSPEVAKILDIPEGTVRNRIFRARQILRQRLKALLERSDGK